MVAKILTLMLFLWGVLLAVLGILFVFWTAFVPPQDLPGGMPVGPDEAWGSPVAGILLFLTGAAIAVACVMLALRLRWIGTRSR